MEWRIADAKNKFSELVNLALSDGPQKVLRRNDAVVVINLRDYEKLIGKRISFKDFLLKRGPNLDNIDLTRDKSTMRDVDL